MILDTMMEDKKFVELFKIVLSLRLNSNFISEKCIVSYNSDQDTYSNLDRCINKVKSKIYNLINIFLNSSDEITGIKIVQENSELKNFAQELIPITISSLSMLLNCEHHIKIDCIIYENAESVALVYQKINFLTLCACDNTYQNCLSALSSEIFYNII